MMKTSEANERRGSERSRWPARLGVLWMTLAASRVPGEPAVASQTNAPPAPPAPPPVSARDFFNAGTRRLNAGKWNEAETFLQTSLARQDEHVRAPALYNLGHARFAQGLEELKKALAAGPPARRGKVAIASAEQAIGEAAAALAAGDVQRMVAAYQRGRGARKELREATKAVQRALELHGGTMRRWQRAVGDFQGAGELNPAVTNAPHNAEVAERAIARLVDSIRDLQQVLLGMERPNGEIEEQLKQLKGRIPDPLMPPGAAGDDEEEEDGHSPEPLPGQKEAPSRDGKEMSLSPEEAGWLLEGFRLDGERRLPMGQAEAGQPKDRKGRDW